MVELCEQVIDHNYYYIHTQKKLESTKIINERKLVGSEASMVELCEQVIDLNYYYIHKKTWKTQKLVRIMQHILESASFVPSTENYEHPR